MAPQFLGLGSGLASPYGVGVGGVSLPAFGALTLTPASPALRALTAPPLPLATVLLVSNLNEEVSIQHNTSVTPHYIISIINITEITTLKPNAKMFLNKQKVIETFGSSEAYRHCISSVYGSFRQIFCRSSMFIGKSIHYANTMASNVCLLLCCAMGARLRRFTYQLTNAYTNIDVTGCCT